MVFLFIPNIIGYLRFAALFAVFPLYRTQPLLTILLYAVSQGLDAFDGWAARKFHQSTRFGAVLDMVCDRASDAVLLAILAELYPAWSWVFLGDIVLDLVSHWYQMYVSLLQGDHHKNSKSRWTLLNLYYGNKTVLFTLVLGNELFLLTAYLNFFLPHLNPPQWALLLNFAGLVIGLILFAIKKLMSIIQLISASEDLAAIDIKERAEKASKSD